MKKRHEVPLRGMPLRNIFFLVLTFSNHLCSAIFICKNPPMLFLKLREVDKSVIKSVLYFCLFFAALCASFAAFAFIFLTSIKCISYRGEEGTQRTQRFIYAKDAKRNAKGPLRNAWEERKVPLRGMPLFDHFLLLLIFPKPSVFINIHL